jgi:hypothetical protein
LRRRRQSLRVALACSPMARILAWEVFTARLPAGACFSGPGRARGSCPRASLVALVCPGSDADFRKRFDDAVGAGGLDVVDGT